MHSLHLCRNFFTLNLGIHTETAAGSGEARFLLQHAQESGKSKCLPYCRCIIQLTLLGYILVPIFMYNQWWLVLLYACFMLYVGCLEAAQRPAYSYTVSVVNL